MKNKLTIVIDSREQRPLDFYGRKDVDVVRRGLKTGDYALDGYEDKIAFERKSAQDLIGTLISGHERFAREIQRSKDFDEFYLLVEESPKQVCDKIQDHTTRDVKGIHAVSRTMFNTMFAYTWLYGTRIKFFENRIAMRDYIIRKCKEYVEKKGEKNESES